MRRFALNLHFDKRKNLLSLCPLTFLLSANFENGFLLDMMEILLFSKRLLNCASSLFQHGNISRQHDESSIGKSSLRIWKRQISLKSITTTSFPIKRHSAQS